MSSADFTGALDAFNLENIAGVATAATDNIMAVEKNLRIGSRGAIGRFVLSVRRPNSKSKGRSSRGCSDSHGHRSATSSHSSDHATVVTCRVFCSRHNAGALDFLLHEVHPVYKHLSVTCDSDTISGCCVMLLYLDARTWTSGENSVALAADVHSAIDKGVKVCLAHEMPGLFQESRRLDEDRYAVQSLLRRLAYCVPGLMLFAWQVTPLHLRRSSYARRVRHPRRCLRLACTARLPSH